MSCTFEDAKFAIETKNISFSYPDGTKALNDISIEINHHENVCIAGANGAGKSTLFLALAGLLKVEGSILINGVPPKTNKHFGLVFQNPNNQLFCPTVEEDIAFGPRNQKLSKDEVNERVKNALKATNIEGFEKRNTHHLSGGEKKKAAIAAVLACAPDIIALDEPWANLDARGAKAVTKILEKFHGAMLVSSQDLYKTSVVCNRLIVLENGRVVEDGDFVTLASDSELMEKYGLEFGERCKICKFGEE